MAGKTLPTGDQRLFLANLSQDGEVFYSPSGRAGHLEVAYCPRSGRGSELWLVHPDGYRQFLSTSKTDADDFSRHLPRMARFEVQHG